MKIVSWDTHSINDTTNYTSVLMAGSYGLAQVKTILGKRHGVWPLIGGLDRPGKQVFIHTIIENTSPETYKKQLHQWFDPEDEDPKVLVCEDDTGGTNDRFIEGICESLTMVGKSGLEWIATIRVHGDIRWREIAITTASTWTFTATGDTKVVANNGQDKAFPILKIKPTGARSSRGFSYKRFMLVKWNIENSALSYPVDIAGNALDTATLITATKMQADGDDLRVYVDGVEADRWLQDINTATTQVWINLDFVAKIPMTLNGSHNVSQTIFYVNEDITNMPSSGIIHDATELITYTGKNDADRQFTGCIRGTKGTTADPHSDGATLNWIQRDVWIYYGDSTLSAPTVDDDYKPMFSLASTNASWVYADFKETAKPNRPGSWQTQMLIRAIEFYGGNQGAAASPFIEVGLHTFPSSAGTQSGYFFIGNPCGITAANFTNGEHYQVRKTYFTGQIKSNPISGGDPGQWISEYTIPDPTTDATWDTWTRNETLDTGSKAVGLYHSGVNYEDGYVEAADCTLTLTTDKYPVTQIQSEMANYYLDCRITNNTTGDAIELLFAMDLNEELEVNTDDKTVIYLYENSNQFNTLILVGGPRVNWLPLDPGNNTLQFADVGTGNVSIVISWWERYYL